MILLVHMLFGAAIGYKIYSVTNNVWLALFLAFWGHYFLDLFPHVEYSVNNIKNKLWKKSLSDFSKIFLDFFFGFFVIFLFSNRQLGGQFIIYLCALTAVIPDGLTFINYIFPNSVLNFPDKIHGGKIHYLTKNKKFPLSWRISTQTATIIISIILLK